MKRLIETDEKDIAMGIVARNWRAKVKSVKRHQHKRQPRTRCPFTIVQFHHPEFLPSRSDLFFIVKPIERARHRLGKRRVKGVAHGIGTRPFSGRHAHVTRILMPQLRAATIAQYTPCAPQFFIGDISLQCPNCL